MKAITVQNPGKDALLLLKETPAPSIAPTEVLIRTEYTSVNRADLLQARGLYPPPKGASPILGLECSGVLEEIGEQALEHNPSLTPGMRVMALLTGGGYAEKVATDSRSVVPIPPGLTNSEAAAFLETYLTAYLNIFLLGEIKKGETVLIHGGSGGVGTAALNLCQAAGVHPIVTAGTDEKCRRCIERGATHAINYTTDDFALQVQQFTSGNGADVILDCIGASYFQKNLDCLATGGRLVVIGLMGGAKTELNLGQLLMKRGQIIGSTLRSLAPEAKKTIIESFQNQFSQPLANGALKPVIHKIVGLENAQFGHEILTERSHFGKVVLQIGAKAC